MQKKRLIERMIAMSLLATTSMATSCNYKVFHDSDYFINGNYITSQQIESIAKSLSCDTSYLLADDYRLAHNDGKPIYVTFSEEFPTEYKAIITQSLDYIFGLLNGINELYHYEIVDSYVSILNYNNIRYEVMTQDSNSTIHGLADHNTNKILINFDAIESSFSNAVEEKIFSTSTHELLHLCGFADVYLDGDNAVSTYYDNTFMQTFHNGFIGGSNEEFDRMITPNDYDCLLATYSPKANNAQELIEITDIANTKSIEYKTNYWNTYVDLTWTNNNAPTEEIANDTVISGTKNIYDKSKSKIITTKTYEIELNDNNYIIRVLDNCGKELESCSGDILHLNTSNGTNNAIVNYNNTINILENVKLSSFADDFYNLDTLENTITDLIIYKLDGKYVVYNPFMFYVDIDFTTKKPIKISHDNDNSLMF